MGCSATLNQICNGFPGEEQVLSNFIMLLCNEEKRVGKKEDSGRGDVCFQQNEQLLFYH